MFFLDDAIGEPFKNYFIQQSTNNNIMNICNLLKKTYLTQKAKMILEKTKFKTKFSKKC